MNANGIKRILNRGTKNTRVELENGTSTLVSNEEVSKWEASFKTQSNSTTLTPAEVRAAVSEHFGHLEVLVDLVVQGKSPSLIVCGDAGIGKTFLVRQRLRKMGLQEQVSIDSGSVAMPNTYLFVKGHSSALGLYTILHNNRESTIVFDDCDSVLKDATAVNILKAALDSYDDRTVSWISSTVVSAGLETRFEFKGRIIFLSNLPMDRIDNAVKSRSFTLEISLTRSELCERMSDILPNIEPNVSMSLKQEVLAHLAANKTMFSEFNMRTLIKSIRLRQSNHPSWQKLVCKFA